MEVKITALNKLLIVHQRHTAVCCSMPTFRKLLLLVVTVGGQYPRRYVFLAERPLYSGAFGNAAE